MIEIQRYKISAKANRSRSAETALTTFYITKVLHNLRKLCIIREKEAIMVRVTSAELAKQFGRYRDVAQREPVTVTHHGRDSLVVMSAEEYGRLKTLDMPRSMSAADISDDDAAAIQAELAELADVEATPMVEYAPK